MADGFQDIITLDNPDSINDLNRMLKQLYDRLAGDGEKLQIVNGFGSPENVIVASIGSLYLRADGGANTSLYVKESGNDLATGWIAK